MPTAGELLRETREKRGLSISQVADLTHLKSDHVRALEEGDYGVFAAPVYAKGSMRTYAKLLKLDPVGLVDRMAEELGEIGKFRDAVGPYRKPSLLDRFMFMLSRVHWRAALGLGIISAATLAGVWGYQRWRAAKSNDPLRDAPPARYDGAVKSGETLPVPHSGTNASGKR